MTISELDAHAHLDFAPDPRELAHALRHAGVGALSMTVTPEGFERARELLGGCENVLVGAGMHPWWVTGQHDADALVELLGQTPVVGEVGLDRSRRHAETFDAQVACFRRVMESCGDGQVISIHSVRAAGAVMDILEETGAVGRCRCVMHWFSGSGPELARAIRLGCWFSVGEPMLATRRGREYARQIPVKRLLLETDLPDTDGSQGAGRILESLARARAQLRGLADWHELVSF